MSYDYKFRLLAKFNGCMTTYQFISEDAAMARYKRLTTNGWKCEIWPIKHNNDPMRADYEYRLFDVVILEKQIGMVLCMPDHEPEFHGFKDDLKSCFDYIDNYWCEKNKT